MAVTPSARRASRCRRAAQLVARGEVGLDRRCLRVVGQVVGGLGRRGWRGVELPVGELVVEGLVDQSAQPRLDGRLERFSNRPCTTWGGRGTSARTDAGGLMRAYSMDLRERVLLDSDAGMKAALAGWTVTP